jgi:hypothetical protein
MSAGQLGYLAGAFAISLFFATVWLIICKVIPPLRRKLGVSYGVAIALAFLPALITIGVSDAIYLNFLGAFLCAGLLFWQYKRAQAKLNVLSKVSNEQTTP